MAKRFFTEFKATLSGVVEEAKQGNFVAKNFEERMSICYRCTQYDPRGWCKSCGCYLKVKAQLAGARCPLGLWK